LPSISHQDDALSANGYTGPRSVVASDQQTPTSRQSRGSKTSLLGTQATGLLPSTDDEDFPACFSPANHGPRPSTLPHASVCIHSHTHLQEYTNIALAPCLNTVWPLLGPSETLSWVQPPATRRHLQAIYGPYFSYHDFPSSHILVHMTACVGHFLVHARSKQPHLTYL